EPEVIVPEAVVEVAVVEVAVVEVAGVEIAGVEIAGVEIAGVEIATVDSTAVESAAVETASTDVADRMAAAGVAGGMTAAAAVMLCLTRCGTEQQGEGPERAGNQAVLAHDATSRLGTDGLGRPSVSSPVVIIRKPDPYSVWP